MARPIVFLSYSQADELWKDRLVAHLRVFERSDRLIIWVSHEIEAESNWPEETRRLIAKAHVAVLLISPTFLASDSIYQHELPALMERGRTQSLAVLPLVVSPSYWSMIPELAALHFLAGGKPLSNFTEPEIDRILAASARQIVEVAKAISEKRAKAESANNRTASSRPQIKQEKKYFISHADVDGDFAELLKLRLEKEGLSAWLDTDRLAPGVDWQVEIDVAIRSSPALIAVMSPEARASEYVTYEWAFAWGCGKKIIPIMLRQTPLHPRLATLQFLDFSNRVSRPWSRLLSTLIGG